MPVTGEAPGRVSPYARPACNVLYGGVLAGALRPTFCERRQHGTAGLDAYHQALLDPLPGRSEPRVLSWA